MIDTTRYGHGTFITQMLPWGLYRTAKVMCSDGKVRTTARLSETSDTFFSVPATVQVKGKKVSGYITVETAEGYSTYVDDDDPAVVKFVAYNYGKNANLLPPGIWVKGSV